MLFDTLAHRLTIAPELSTMILLFFVYSLLGHYLECAVLTIEKRRLVVNRGFATHMPFCVIYGFGALSGYVLLAPYQDSLVLLFFLGAVCATTFEYLTAKLQLRIFGSFWWDYHNKPFNYKGIICLESTIGWGLAAILVVRVLHRPLAGIVARVPVQLATPLAILLMALYVGDFILSARAVVLQRQKPGEPQWEEDPPAGEQKN